MISSDLENLNSIIRFLLNTRKIPRQDSQAYVSTLRRVIAEIYPDEYCDGTTPSELDELDEICYEIEDGEIEMKV
ncbi:hypothetical protein [Pseudobutyrivibrio sp.]|uniref:hypothetical protein n=1 Tax=Pseudobutyrivibrio sp. TaxID=2014367 RepID=UPI001D8D9BA8|nr:hypothetical protein [Pseudobutyrivibrio sp.]MBE5912004.1 hypothetical protein [Pseudobutyrivibrio sp.]